MTARAQLERFQNRLRIALILRALCIAFVSGAVVFVLLRLFGIVGPRIVIGSIAGVLAGAVILWRNRTVQSLPQVALWVEEQTPQLKYSLVTIAEGATSPLLDAQALSIPWWSTASSLLWRSLIVPAGVAALVLLVFFVSPLQGFTFFDPGRPHGFSGKSDKVTDVLARVHAHVVSPAYSRKAVIDADDPTSVEALIGSAITIDGPGDAQLLTATTDSQPRSVAQRSSGWSLSLTMPARPALIRLHSKAGRDKLIVLAPVVDASPAVTLLLPARDTILRRPTGSIPLRAQLRDDIGLRDADFEFVISSGGGENFTFRQGVLSRIRLDDRTESTLDSRVSIDSLGLKPGDILQLRAVARDANNVNGPGIGSSETRSIRIARPDEYDSLSVEAAAPPDSGDQVMSQRILINLTEALVRKQPKITHQVLLEESRKIAFEQARLRKHVGDVVFQRMGADPLSEEGAETLDKNGKLSPEDILRMADSLTGGNAGGLTDVEGDETPILAINKPLLEAFNAMWDAGRALEIGEPSKALPPMRIALAAIQKARAAERIYLRGRPGTNIVDVAKVRMSGKDKGVASIREARALVDPVVRRRAASFERITSMLATNPEAAADSLLVMRVDALGDAPALASALDEAARALRKRDNSAIGLAWTRVRRALGRPPRQSAGVSLWTTSP